MKKEKFTISAILCDENNKFVDVTKIEVDGWTHEGLGYYKKGDKYSITHLNTGSSLCYAKTKEEAETFIKSLTKDIDCTTEIDKFRKEIIEYIKQPNNIFEVMGVI